MSDTEELLHARTSYAASLISSISYGLYIALAVLALNLLRKRRESSSGTMLMIGYTSGMLLLTSAWYVAGATYSARDLIDGARNPARWDTLQCSPAGIAKDVLATLLVFSSDGLMLYRVYVIWNDSWFVIGPLAFMYLGILGTGVTLNLLCASADFGGTLPLPLAVNVAVPFWVLSIAHNALATALIAGKLLVHRRALRTLDVSVVHSNTSAFASIAGILAESAAPYTLVGLVYIPLFAIDSPVSAPWSSLFAAMSYLCPAWIILRCASGAAYRREQAIASAQTPNLSFAPNPEMAELSRTGSLEATVVSESRSTVWLEKDGAASDGSVCSKERMIATAI